MSKNRTGGGFPGAAPSVPAAELPAYAERVLDVADLIPPGRVMTYGDVAEWLGDGGPRQVGRVMALYGSAVPWWRVVRADGALLPGHEQRALGHYREEGTPLRTAPRGAEGHLPRLDMKHARWDGVVGGGGDPDGSCGRGRSGPEGDGPGGSGPDGNGREGDGPDGSEETHR
ncbi:MGMT family protein [Streptomyces sp. NPDC020403]|uniref:MGMT family protein n=1 Tax=unclassified Streptomyces TaxID=2593676 RepID=UPI00340A82EE